MKRILVPVDFSVISGYAVEAAIRFCEHYSADLYIFHNTNNDDELHIQLDEIESISLISGTSKNHSEQLRNWGEQGKRKGFAVHFIIQSGHFLANMKRVNEKYTPDLILMSSTGAGGKREYLWGSNTENVVQSVDCPVLVIKEELKTVHFNSIVYASSFKLEEAEVFQYALDLLKLSANCVIHLLSIDTYAYFSQPTVVMQAAMKDFQNLAKPLKSEIHFYRDFDVDAGIRHFSEEIKPDLLIMSNHFDKPIRRMFNGNDAIRMVNHSEYPVLIVDYK